MPRKLYSAPTGCSALYEKYWKAFIADIMGRDDFKKGHLKLLEILCQQYEEYFTLNQFLQEHGFTYESEGRNGNQIKPRPEVSMRAACLSEIRNYSRSLGLNLKNGGEAEEEEVDEWGVNTHSSKGKVVVPEMKEPEFIPLPKEESVDDGFDFPKTSDADLL